MHRPAPSAARQLLAALAIALTALVIVVLTVGPASSGANSRSLESMFQDDDHLIYGSTATVVRTLDQLQRLGVQRIRVTVLWRAIAPDPHSRLMPRGFNGSDPAAYPSRSWALTTASSSWLARERCDHERRAATGAGGGAYRLGRARRPGDLQPRGNGQSRLTGAVRVAALWTGAVRVAAL